MTINENYVAKLSNLAPEDRDFLKARTCVLTISVGQPSHEGKKFRATLKLMNLRFAKCIVSVNDVSQRYNLAIKEAINKNIRRPADYFYEDAKLMGDDWIERNLPTIQQELKIPFELVRWEYYLNHSKFSENYDEVKNLYLRNVEYRQAIEDTILDYYNRNQDEVISSGPFDLYQHYCREFLLEECAAVLEWYDNKYEYEAYPSVSGNVIRKTFDLLRPGGGQFVGRRIKINFKKKSNPKENTEDALYKVALENILEISPEHIYWKNIYGSYLGCNVEQANAYNRKKISEVIGKSDFDFYDMKNAMIIRQNDLKVMENNSKVIAEEMVKIKGEDRYFLSYKNPLRDLQNNEVIGVIGISVDITTQKQQELELLEKNKLLEKALQVKSELLNNISHEIKTPLSSILKMTDILYEQWDVYESNDVRKEHLKLAVEASKRLSGILFNLLDISQIRSGKIEYSKQKYSLFKSTKDVISEFIEHKNRFVVNNNIENFLGFYDPTRIEQVIRNLISNSIRYGGDETIVIDIAKSGDDLHFSITDTGLGIPEDELEYIFDIFNQSSRTRTKAGGTGIGLSICKKIIAGHNGKIGAINNVNGRGSSFWFKIPISSNNIKEVLIKEKNESKPLVLLIDDQESVLQVTSIILMSLGFDVMLANCGMDGLSKLENHYKKINLVLLDIMMPDVYGIDLLRQIKNDSKLRSVPVLMYSGASDPQEISRSLEIGADGYIDKTSTRQQMEKVIKKYLSAQS